MVCSPPGFSVYEIFQVRILEWLPFTSPGDLPDVGIKCTFRALAGEFFTTVPPGKLYRAMDSLTGIQILSSAKMLLA